METKPFLTPAEVCDILDIRRETFYAIAPKGEIPGAVKVGGQWRINSRVFWAAMNKTEGKAAS